MKTFFNTTCYSNSFRRRPLGSNAHFSIRRSPEVSRGSTRDLKFAKLKPNMVARGLLRKTFFSAKFSKRFAHSVFFFYLRKPQSFGHEHSFKPLCPNVNENCNVLLLSIAPAIYPKTAEKKATLQFSLVFFTCPVPPAFGYLWASSSPHYQYSRLFAWNCGLF